MSSDYKKEFLAKKYAKISEEVPHKKKKKKKIHKKTNHKHVYAPCYFLQTDKKIALDGEGTYCTICGRIGNLTWSNRTRWTKNIPVKEIESWRDKYVSI